MAEKEVRLLAKIQKLVSATHVYQPVPSHSYYGNRGVFTKAAYLAVVIGAAISQDDGRNEFGGWKRPRTRRYRWGGLNDEKMKCQSPAKF